MYKESYSTHQGISVRVWIRETSPKTISPTAISAKEHLLQ